MTPATRPTDCSLCCPQEDVSAASDPALVIYKGKALMHTSGGVFIVGARWRMMTCDDIVVVSQFLGEYFHPYPLTLCFKGQGEGLGRGV